MPNIRLTIEFDGTAYAGWQFQPDRPTVQGEIEAAAAKIAGEPITVYGCSRTDAGVSARGYVANFHTDSALKAERWRLALNDHLPKDIHVKTAAPAPENFHARYDARGKTYVYRIVLGISPLRRGRAWEARFPVDSEKMGRAARLFIGTKDFRPFCSTDDNDGRCTIKTVNVRRRDDEITVTVKGDRFLYKMVRRIVGAIATYGMGRIGLADLRLAIAGKPHRYYQTAPAQGLLLDSVRY